MRKIIDQDKVLAYHALISFFKAQFQKYLINQNQMKRKIWGKVVQNPKSNIESINDDNMTCQIKKVM
jgi:hypothetical protein